MTSLKFNFWREHLEKIAASGVAISAYCKEHGLSPASVYHWRKRINEESTTGGFDEVAVDPEEEAPGFTLDLSALDQSILCRLVLMLAGQENA